MSDAPHGDGWWLASDAKWYPPLPAAAPPPSGAASPHPAAPRRRAWPWILGVAVVGLVVVVGGAVALGTAIGHASQHRHVVTFLVTGGSDAIADVSYGDLGGLREPGTDVGTVALPWTATITTTGLLNFAVVSATGGGSTPLACTIEVDGVHRSHHASTGSSVACVALVGP